MLLALLSFGCKTPKSASKLASSMPKLEMIPYYNSTGKMGYLVNSSSISGDVLSIQITYLGNCKEHTFKLVCDSSISNPEKPITNVYLLHDDNLETCTLEVKKELKFDISRLKNLKKNPILIDLNKLQTLEYKY